MSGELVGQLRSLTNGDKVKIGSNKPFLMKEMTPYPTSHTIYGIVTDTEVGLGGIRMFQLREIELDVIGSAAGTAALTIEKAVGEENLDETSMGKFISSVGSADHVFGSGGGVRKKIKKRRTKRRRTKRRRTKRR